MIIGYLHRRKKPMGLNKAYAFAAVAKAEGVKFLFFSPCTVDFQNRKIEGYVYENGEWIQIMSEFPDVICNVVGFSNEKQDGIIDKLMEEIPFTSYSIGSKMNVFNNLKKYKKFSDYLIHTKKVLSVEHFFKFIDKYKKIVLKPSEGCKGIDIYYIKKENDFYEVRLGDESIYYDSDKMSQFIMDKIDKAMYLVQPYINCRTKSGAPYDFRLHVQKNLNAEWVASCIYPRISITDNIICNLSSGGYITELTTFLKSEFDDNHTNIKNYIEVFSIQLAKHMDEIQKELYGEELDELGIDIGLDEDQKIRLYEVNWRPGLPPSWYVDLTTVRNKIHYAMFLAKREGRNV